MLGKSIKPHSNSLNTPCKLSAAIAASIAVSIMGVTVESPQTSLMSNPKEELSLIKPRKVIIDRYEITDPTTGSAIYISQIKSR